MQFGSILSQKYVSTRKTKCWPVILRLCQPRKHLSCCKYLSVETPTTHNPYSYRYSPYSIHYISSSWFQDEVTCSWQMVWSCMSTSLLIDNDVQRLRSNGSLWTQTTFITDPLITNNDHNGSVTNVVRSDSSGLLWTDSLSNILYSILQLIRFQLIFGS